MSEESDLELNWATHRTEIQFWSTWRVERAVPVLRNIHRNGEYIRACGGCEQHWENAADWDANPPEYAISDAELIHSPDCKLNGIRALALTPDGSEVVEVFEGKTAEAVQRKIIKSGLVTSIGGAMWLGRELEKMERVVTHDVEDES
jgi:hypothetical protein